MASDRGVRKTCLSGGGNCAQRHGAYAANKGGCCCSTEQCVTAWKATPCFAGECNGDSTCGCPACYPTGEIYVCTDALCDCAGGPVTNVIVASYDFAPGVKWCFTIDRSTEYPVADLPGNATVVGFAEKCVTCSPLGCSASICPPARGRWVRPIHCDPRRGKEPPCAWVCPSSIVGPDCAVLSTFNHTGVPGCCYFPPAGSGGIVEEGFFEGCPDYAYLSPNYQWAGPSKTCCDCEIECGGSFRIEDAGQEQCAGSFVYAKALPANPTYCCCPQPTTIHSITFDWRGDTIENGQDNWIRYAGTCNCDGAGNTTGQVFVEGVQFGSYSSEYRPCSSFWSCYSCYEDPIPGLANHAWGSGSKFGYCNDISYQSNQTTGSITVTCDSWNTNVTNTIVYVNGGGTRIETIVGHATFNRNINAKCKPTCDGSVVRIQGRRLRRSGVVKEKSSGGFL